jgi:LacI family transcriptional regulator
MDTEEYLTAIRKIIENGINVVFVDRSFPSLNVSSICHDDFAGGYEACTHLINQHDCPVYYFGNTLRPSSSHLRYEGWFRAMRENYPHLSIDKKFILESPLPEAEAASAFHNKWEKLFYQSACEYLNSIKDEKLCVFAVNDDAARVFMDAAKDTGRVVGENFFIVGFGDKPFCEKIKPTLSSVMQHDKKMGYEAAALLRDIISNPDLSLHKINRNVFVQLKVRASSLKN